MKSCEETLVKRDLMFSIANKFLTAIFTHYLLMSFWIIYENYSYELSVDNVDN